MVCGVLPHFRTEIAPLADQRNVVAGPTYRITVLDEGLVRLEYSGSGEFEDRASQFAVDRAFAPTKFTVIEDEDLLEIHTSRFQLTYDKGPFRAEGLSAVAKQGTHSVGSVWRYGMATRNLGGTARTLDEVDGATSLEPGVLSRFGITAVDDSSTVLLDENGWIAQRHPGNLDVYVFAYGTEYRAALNAYHRLAGRQPLLPRFALGNWWSRYHPYSADEYLELMDRFAAEHVPLSVAVLDMDWHRVHIDPKYGTGWTGYSWNTDLFPDPPAFLAELHDRGLVTSLNVHPSEGVHAHEDRYRAMAERLGVDPDTERPIAFDPADPEFLEAYFEQLHHPLEDEGVDFWWLDWQQGGVSAIPGLDPLWLLNHYHFLDSARNGRRPLTFSRYAGLGSHRYPVGFSGDTVISWASLDFQPYFTATASNVGYGWWSHDIGGHFFGYKDDELATRWVQFGVFSPVTRLHSSLSLFNSKEPWRFDEHAERVMKSFLRLRHQLVPYLYTMNRRAHLENMPLVAPVYYEHPDEDAAYRCPNEYLFGTAFLVAPITSPADPGTRLGSTVAWLPPGRWIDVFTGLTYHGGRTVSLHRDLDSIPVLARAGSIVPVVPAHEVSFGTANPDALEIRVSAGADGEFTMWEDQDDERWARTRFTFTGGEFRIHPTEGATDAVPSARRYTLVLCGFGGVASVARDGAALDLVPGPVPGSVRADLGTVAATDGAIVRVDGDLGIRANDDARARVFTLLDRAQIEFALKERVYDTLDGELDQVVAELTALELPSALCSAVVELITA
jgi:alpha-glucosidase (family GH31 glycosyl hydrolase)